MKVLQLCHKPPYPPLDGGCLAINNITTGLISQGVDLKLLTVSTHKHPFRPNEIPEDWLLATKAEGTFVDTKINAIDAFSSIVTRDSYNINRFFSSDFDILLSRTLRAQQFDIVHIESLFMTPYIHTIRRLSKAKIILRSHNLEYMIWNRMATASSSSIKKLYLNYLARQLKDYEISVVNQVDGIVAISPIDANTYQNLTQTIPVVTVPFGLNLDKYALSKNKTNNLSLFHLGAMDWLPNVEGVNWFLKNTWSDINKTHPNLSLFLAGKSSETYKIPSKYANINLLGTVKDSAEFMNDHDVMIVPLLSGGGIRIKIIEGMALGKTIISTTVGAEGITYENGVNILIADTPQEFLDTISKLINNPSLITEIGEKARKNAATNYQNSVLSENLVSFYSELL